MQIISLGIGPGSITHFVLVGLEPGAAQDVGPAYITVTEQAFSAPAISVESVALPTVTSMACAVPTISGETFNPGT